MRRLRQGRTVQLGQAVDEPAEPVGLRVGMSIPAVIVTGVPEAEVGAEVDDARGERGERVDAGHGTAVWQAKEQQIAGGEAVCGRKLEARAPPKVGVREVHELTVEPLAGDLLHANVRVLQQQAEQFASGVAGGADNRGGDRA